MKNLIILTSRCFEDAYANGICAQEIRKALKENSEINKVFLVGYTKKSGFDGFFDEENYKFTYYRINKCSKLNSLKKTIKPYIRKDLVDKYVDVAKKIISTNRIDAIISMFFPLESLIAAQKIKKMFPNITTISYQFDSATDIGVFSSKLSPLHIRAYTNYLNKLYSDIDYIIAMESNKKDIQKRYYKHNDKIHYVNSLALYDFKGLDCNINNTINFLYTGTLDKDNYTPIPFFELFSLNPEKTNWRLHFFSRGNCEDLIYSASQKDKRIVQHGYIDNSLLNEHLRKADFLLSTDNILKPNCIPYKILNYFSFGKPIIHFTKINGFTVENYINKYPISLCINQDNIPNENQKILSFIDKYRGKTVDKDYVFSTFYKDTPAYSADMIIEILNKTKR